SMSNPPNANPPLPAAVQPRLQATATDVQHFSVVDMTCNSSSNDPCTVELFWQAVNNVGTQLFYHQGASARVLVSCSTATSWVDLPWISGSNLIFELYQLSGCPSSVPGGAQPIASLTLSLVTAAPPNLIGRSSRKTHGAAGTFDLALA